MSNDSDDKPSSGELDKTLSINHELKTLTPKSILAGRFEIEKKIGQGSFGQVYKAKDLHLGTVIAIKLLHDKYSKIKGE